MLVKLASFAGIIPRVAPHLLPDPAATLARNCKLGTGALRAFRSTLPVNTPTKPGTKSTIFPFEGYWLHWVGQDVDVVRSPIADDAFKRVYWTGDGAPKMAPLDILAAGGTNYPNNSYALGIPAPVNAPTVTAIAPAAYDPAATYVEGDLVTKDAKIYMANQDIETPEAWDATHWDEPDVTLYESRVYCYRYLSAYGEPGPPSPPSAKVVLAPGQKVQVDAMDTAPTGPYNIETKELFRSNTGSTDTAYLYTAAVAVATSGYEDSKEASALGEMLDSILWDAPPADLTGLRALPNGCLAGFSGKKFCLSVPYMPHAWPVNYRVTVPDQIVSIEAFGNRVLITTTGAPYVITVQDPENLSPPERLETGYACVSKRGTVDMGFAVIYPEPGGLRMAGVNGAELATDKVMTRDDWQARDPASLHAYLYEGCYVGFTSTGTFMFNPSTGDLVDLDVVTTAGYHDPATGDLYLQVGNDIVRWDAGTGSISYTWRSKPFIAPRKVNLSVAQVYADAYPVTVNVYADGVLKYTKSVADDKPFRLSRGAAGFRAIKWQVEAVGTNGVNIIYLAQTMRELAQA